MPGNARDPTEPSRIGRMHARLGKEPNVRSQIARRLGGSPATKASRQATGSSHSTSQRVAVRAHISRHRPSTARGNLLRYASYLGRDSASRDGAPGVFFDATREEVPASATLGEWAQDRHHFRLMLSPEQAADLQDLTGYARRVMNRMSRDVGTPLTYLAITHHNTDNPHIHVIVRGKKPDGADLVVPWNYLSKRLPQRASDVATDLLGPRDPEVARRTADRTLQAQKYTLLDRRIREQLRVAHGIGTLDLGAQPASAFQDSARTRMKARLAFLASVGLARKDRGTRWLVDLQLDEKLTALGRHQALMERLSPLLGSRAMQVERLGDGAQVNGLVVARGAVDDLSDKRFVVVEDARGNLYYVPLKEGRTYQAARHKSALQVTREPTSRRRETGQERFRVRVQTLDRNRQLSRDYGV